MQKIILFYKFLPITDTESVMHWQRLLAASNQLTGRILISEHGINGTLGGELTSLKRYVKAMNLHSRFKGITYKWSDGDSQDFPRLMVKIRDEIVTFGVPDEVKVDDIGIVGGGKHLKPSQVHDLVKERGDEVVFLDGRNSYEAAIGKFKGAIVPAARTTKDFIRELDTPQMQKLKNKPIVSYCTGGIRCEILTTLMKSRGFSEVYQIDGGIAKYGQVYGDEGLWEGKLYVFDKRMQLAFSQNSKDIGICSHCQQATSNYENCANAACNELILMCTGCVNTLDEPYCVNEPQVSVA